MNRKRIFIVFFMFFIIIGCNKQNYYTKDEELPTIVEMVNESMGKGYKNSFKKETIELTNECSCENLIFILPFKSDEIVSSSLKNHPVPHSKSDELLLTNVILITKNIEQTFDLNEFKYGYMGISLRYDDYNDMFKIEKYQDIMIDYTINNSEEERLYAYCDFIYNMENNKKQPQVNFKIAYLAQNIMKNKNDGKIIKGPDLNCKEAYNYIKKYSFFWIKTEFNSQYAPESLLGNFDRLLKSDTWVCYDPILDKQCSKVYYFEINKGNFVDIHLVIYPYKNGSKAVITAKIPVIFQGNKADLSSLIDIVKKEIKKVIED